MSDEPTRSVATEASLSSGPRGADPSPDLAQASALVPVPNPGLGMVATGTVGPPARSEPPPASTASPDSPVADGPDDTTHDDPFPREAWTTLTSHAAGYLRLTIALLRDPAVSKHRRAALLAAAAYFASPIDLIPGIVPVLGQVDDLAVAMLAIRLALNALEPGRRQMHLAAAGLSDETLREDLLAAGRLGAWAARTGVRTGIRVGRGAVRFTVQGGRTIAALAVRGGRSAVRRAAPALDPTSAAAGQAATVAERATSTVRQAGGKAASRAGDAAGRATSTGRRLAERVRRRGTSEVGPDAPVDGASARQLASESVSASADHPVADRPGSDAASSTTASRQDVAPLD